MTRDTHLFIRTSIFYRSFSAIKTLYHIFGNVYQGDKSTKSSQLTEIIQEIHQKRFDPENLFLISGDHFSSLYIRSLGIFYASLLDPRTALNEIDWLNRQKIYLQTTAYALEVFSQSSFLSTTIVPVGVRSVSLLNIYSPPSDSLFSLLYALRVMQTSEDLLNIYPFESNSSPKLQTSQAAQILLFEYQDTLLRHYQNYIASTVDPSTDLIKKNILLSGTKDITKRESAFYDNVILWKTQQLAQQLGIVPVDQDRLNALKKRILKTYWLSNEGYFLEDQSMAARDQGYYSSDWLIVLQTGFLSPQNPEERFYFEESVSYIQQNKLDQPFGLRYQLTNRAERVYPLVQLFLPEYGGTTIWSNWGMEYIKLLMLLHKETGNANYLETAKRQLQSYSDNIVKYHCYPEVYDSSGKMLRNFFYKSVCQTGWVVSYEQAVKMVE